MSNNSKKSKSGYQSRRTTVLLLQLMPLFTGMVGVYLVSAWAVEMREEFDLSQGSIAYYLGLILIMLALQGPVLIEIYRRRAKNFMMRRVVTVFVALAASLIIMVWNVTPDITDEMPMADYDD